MNHVVGWQPTKLHYFKQLVVVVLAWKNWSFDEEFDFSAAKRPHINAMVVSWNLLSFCHSEKCSKQDFRSSIIARLDVGVDLAALKRSAAKVNEL